MPISDDQLLAIGRLLCDKSRPLKERFRALFTLRNVGGPIAIQCICSAFSDSSALLKHECAYCLGQMQDPIAIPRLISVLEDRNQEPMVRHEAGTWCHPDPDSVSFLCERDDVTTLPRVTPSISFSIGFAGEALGAIGDNSVMEVLVKYSDDPIIEVAETCQLAVKRLEWLNNHANSEVQLTENPYASVDPAPPASTTEISVLQNVLVDDSADLFERYRAMFTLRNIGTDAAIMALSNGLRYGSALFRHEVAYVLGQVQSPVSVPQLIASLSDSSENEMVRHECAEALGSIAGEDVQVVLQKYLGQQEPRVVRESCEIALDMCDYETSKEFQYANALGKIH